MRGREFPSASWQILSWITMEYYAMLLSMNEGRPCHQSVNKRVKWLGALAVLLFGSYILKFGKNFLRIVSFLERIYLV